jgi:hypothetical protein
MTFREALREFQHRMDWVNAINEHDDWHYMFESLKPVIRKAYEAGFKEALSQTGKSV